MEFTSTYCKATYYIVYIEKVLNTCKYTLTCTSVMICPCSETRNRVNVKHNICKLSEKKVVIRLNVRHEPHTPHTTDTPITSSQPEQSTLPPDIPSSHSVLRQHTPPNSSYSSSLLSLQLIPQPVIGWILRMFLKTMTMVFH